MAKYVTQRMEKKINECLRISEMMAESESYPGTLSEAKLYWTGYARAIGQMKRILAGEE